MPALVAEVQVGPWTLAPEGRKQRIVRYCPPAPTNPVIRKLAGLLVLLA